MNLPKLTTIKTITYLFFSFLFMLFFQSTSQASDLQQGFAFDAQGQVIFDNYGNCVRTVSPSQSQGKVKCGYESSSTANQV